jgi:hypothetical protein
MQLAKEVQSFSGVCERLLSTIVMNRQLSEDETCIIEYYCKELLSRIEPRLSTRPSRFWSTFVLRAGCFLL